MRTVGKFCDCFPPVISK